MVEQVALNSPAEPVVVGVVNAADVQRANAVTARFARTVGFSSTEIDELTLVVSELASNLVRHAGGGTLKLTGMQAGGRRGMQIESEDVGPGIADIELALEDGYSTAGGLGNGLGTVHRLMDQLEFRPRPHAGLHIVCQRWVRPVSDSLTAPWLEFGAATRAYRLGPENGDAFVIKQWEGGALAGVIDGLGHGRFAQRAAQTAWRYVQQHFDQPLEHLFRGVARACRATRGVVMGLCRFHQERRVVVIGNIGNIEIRLRGSGPAKPTVRRGVLGLHAPNLLMTEHPWTSDSLLVAHSDGVSSRWEWNDFPAMVRPSPAAIAQQLLKGRARSDDDATVIVVKNASA